MAAHPRRLLLARLATLLTCNAAAVGAGRCPRNGTLLDAKGLGADVSTVTGVCCPATCRSCFQQARKACQRGDAHWSAERCCGGDIVASRLYCSDTTQPPCIIGSCTSWRPYLPWPWPHVDQSDEPPPPTDFFKVLLVVPLAISQANFAEEMIPKALAASVDVFIAHYDGGREWYARNMPWHANVTYSHVNTAGFKASFVLNELVLPHHHHRGRAGDAGESILSKYSHVWVTDGDIQWPSLADVNQFLNVIKEERPLIAQPTM
mmetsp:Transcript_73729/g.210186  ORF Transcript_73729/g.210186 Transcript_73729/m.210186 type:complete len:263 (-) Transcript_73729:875-1663(-)